MEDGERRRDRHQIAVEILEAARGGAKKTHIMYKCKLSYTQIRQYLPLLIEKGLLENLSVAEKRAVTQLFRTSDSGRKLIEDFRTLEI
jgi:predicted transcriptional regulator